jgi:cytochrome c oxidase cbb3-type subunit 2
VGVPYSDDMIANARADLLAQLDPGADTSALLKRYPGAVSVDSGAGHTVASEMDALIAYLQMVGTLVKFPEVEPADLEQ